MIGRTSYQYKINGSPYWVRLDWGQRCEILLRFGWGLNTNTYLQGSKRPLFKPAFTASRNN
jgi:hypothetical protein